MLDFISSIGSAISTVFEIITTVISAIVSVFTMLVDGLVFITYCIGLLPTFLIVFATAGIMICIVLHILGR